MVECPHENCRDSNKDFQSDATMRQHHTKVHEERLPNSECKSCGNEFFRKSGGMYCDDCKEKRYLGSNNPNYKDAKEKADCDECGKGFEYYPSEKDGLYCEECAEDNVWESSGKKDAPLPDKYHEMSYDEDDIGERKRELSRERRGDVSEYKVTTKFLESEVSVLEPVTDNEPYDIVVESGDFVRVQIKTGRVRDGCILFHSQSTHTNSNGTVCDDYVGDIDLFAIYTPEIDKIHLVPIEDIGDSRMRLRVRPPKIALSMSRINWAKNYEFRGDLADIV